LWLRIFPIYAGVGVSAGAPARGRGAERGSQSTAAYCSTAALRLVGFLHGEDLHDVLQSRNRHEAIDALVSPSDLLPLSLGEVGRVVVPELEQSAGLRP
jgi:hypothetical protein